MGKGHVLGAASAQTVSNPHGLTIPIGETGDTDCIGVAHAPTVLVGRFSVNLLADFYAILVARKGFLPTSSLIFLHGFILAICSIRGCRERYFLNRMKYTPLFCSQIQNLRFRSGRAER